MLKFAMYFLMFVGAMVIAAWISKEINAFFNSLWFFVRYHWLPFLGSLIVAIIAYQAFSSKS